MKSSKLNKKGFTLIEVVLVLAIGGLIFLLAFLAFGQASKNRRDTQRRSDVARVVAEIQNAVGDNYTVPTTDTGWSTFGSTYLGSLKTPLGGTYTYKDGTSLTGTVSQDTIYIKKDSVCNGNNGFSTSNGNFAAVVGLEKGSACRDDK